MKKTICFFSAAALWAGAAAQNSASNPLEGFYSESFAGCRYESVPWEVIPVSGETSTVGLIPYDETTGLVPHIDADGGMLLISNDKSGTFILALPWLKVASDCVNPQIKYSSYCDPSVSCKGLLAVDGGAFEDDVCMTLFESDPLAPSFSLISQSGWPELNTYAGRSVRFAMKVTTDGSGGHVAIDRVRFGDMPKYDFGVGEVFAPAHAEEGRGFTAYAVLRAYGSLGSDNYKIVVRNHGEEIAEVKSADLESKWLWEGNKVTAPVTLTPGLDCGDMELTFEMVQSKDTNAGNNTSEPVIVKVVPADLPAPDNLVMTANNGSYDLTWNAPATETGGTPVTDGLEDFSSWWEGGLRYNYSVNPVDGMPKVDNIFIDNGRIGAYRVIDNDHRATVVPAELQTAAAVNLGNAMSCIVADFPAGSPLSAYSGTKAFAFLSNADESVCDNYLILPHTAGSASETVSFMARALGAEYPEEIEILASKTGRSVADFEPVRSEITITGAEYSKVEATLPEGTTYVAIHHVSEDGRVLLIDDITYTPGAPSRILGYNVYSGLEKVNSEPVSSTVMPDMPYADNYRVTAIYPEGESAFSDKAKDSSGVSEVWGDGTDSAPLYYNLQGIRVDNPHGGVFIKVEGKHSKKLLIE